MWYMSAHEHSVSAACHSFTTSNFGCSKTYDALTCNFLQANVNSCLLGKIFLLIFLFSDVISIFYSVWHHRKAKYMELYSYTNTYI